MKEEKLQKEMALERIGRLFDLAYAKTEAPDVESRLLARKYMNIARRISLHYKIRLPEEIKNKICKRCNSVLIPGITCAVRVNKSFVLYKCNCGRESRIFIRHHQKG